MKFISKYYGKNPVRLGGGLGTIVQIYETKLNFNVKSHRWRSGTHADWALTMADISVSPSRSYAQMVPNRTKEMLLPIIKNVVRTKTKIHTDE